MSDYEHLLQQTIFPDLIRGRKDFDLPHTKAVVYWIKEILKSEPQLDQKVLITAAYAHDWGYIDLGVGKSLAAVMAAKQQHMIIGSERIYNFLKQHVSDKYTPAQIDRVKHLVFVHDKLNQVSADDEIALVEADTLGSLDSSRVKPTFSQEDNEKYIHDVFKYRRPLFRHQMAIQWFDILVPSRQNYYQPLNRSADNSAPVE